MCILSRQYFMKSFYTLFLLPEGPTFKTCFNIRIIFIKFTINPIKHVHSLMKLPISLSAVATRFWAIFHSYSGSLYKLPDTRKPLDREIILVNYLYDLYNLPWLSCMAISHSIFAYVWLPHHIYKTSKNIICIGITYLDKLYIIWKR